MANFSLSFVLYATYLSLIFWFSLFARVYIWTVKVNLRIVLDFILMKWFFKLRDLLNWTLYTCFHSFSSTNESVLMHFDKKVKKIMKTITQSKTKSTYYMYNIHFMVRVALILFGLIHQLCCIRLQCRIAESKLIY